jgi:thiopeptide-type bacteriocin biosynthesis protein
MLPGSTDFADQSHAAAPPRRRGHIVAGSSRETLFRSADILLVRAAVHPFPPPGADCAQLAHPDDDSVEYWYTQIRALVADPDLREAVAVASPTLSRALGAVLAGTSTAKVKDLRRLALGLVGYHLRMATRSTPFGLFAGVAAARFGATAQARLGRSHRTHTRPDAGWLLGLVTRLEIEPGVLEHLRLVVNRASTVRGGRVELTDLSDGGAADADRLPAVVSVRLTTAVDTALRAASSPVAYHDVVHALRVAFPAVLSVQIETMLVGLVQRGFLLTDLRPPFDCAEPLGYVLARLTDHPLRAELCQIEQAIASYDRSTLGQGQLAFEQLRKRMCVVQPTEHPLQVDLALDAEIQLPPLVAREVEQAAETLWRLSPQRLGSSRLRDFHHDFLQRYGTDRAVPLTELLSGELGLGLPAAYQPGSGPPRTGQRGRTSLDVDRDRVLARLAAAARGRQEVVLDDDMMERLDRNAPAGSGAPGSMELYAHLVSPSTRALWDGDFRLVLGPYVGSQRIGAMFGRFAYLLGDATRELAALVRHIDGDPPDAVRAALVYQPRLGRSANVVMSPRWLDHRIPVGVGSFDPTVVDLAPDDLAVLATPERLWLMSLCLGRQVVPTAFNVLNPALLAPGIARFLDDMGREGVCSLRGWDWGAVRSSPFLPRVRRGRTVLASATWQVDETLVGTGARTPENEWVRRLMIWRTAAGVPDRVLFAEGDQCIPLDLDDRLHRLVLRRECSSRTHVVVQEVLGDNESDGWLVGPRGPHHCEIVVPLVRREPNGAPANHGAAVIPSLRVRPRGRDELHLPGGQWLYAKIYTAARRQPELLLDHVSVLLDSVDPGVVDHWFFVRYADPWPHLRLRLHGDAAALWVHAVPALHAWAAELRRSGLVGNVVLDSYDPEMERYGGPEAIADAERAFHADSVSAIALLRACGGQPAPVDRILVGALSILELFSCLGRPEDMLAWLSRTGAKTDYRAAFTSRRRDVVQLADPGGDWSALAARPGGPALLEAWRLRRPAIAAYGGTLRQLVADDRCWTPLTRVAANLAHMHCNRLFGVDRVVEGQVLAVARNTMLARADRDRLGS